MANYLTEEENRKYHEKYPDFDPAKWYSNKEYVFNVKKNDWRFFIERFEHGGKTYFRFCFSDERRPVDKNGTPYPLDLFNVYGIALTQKEVESFRALCS